MQKTSDEMTFIINEAAEGDWVFITRGQIEIAWTRVDPKERDDAGRDAVVEAVTQHVARIRQDEGFPDCALVARTAEGVIAGYVWVAKDHNDATGEVEASLLSQYVAESYRGHGLGRVLMERAEAWASRQGLPCISLFVGADNRLAQGLYKSLGYDVETLRMTKCLDAPTSADPSLSDY